MRCCQELRLFLKKRGDSDPAVAELRCLHELAAGRSADATEQLLEQANSPTKSFDSKQVLLAMSKLAALACGDADMVRKASSKLAEGEAKLAEGEAQM